jgi:endoglucanase
MRKYFLHIILLTSIVSFASMHVYAQQFLQANGKYLSHRNKEVLLRGIGLGGWMLQEPYMLQLSGVAKNQSDIKKKITDLIGEERTNRFYNAWLENHCTKKDIDALAAMGFNSVRLPMHYDLYTLAVEKEKDSTQNTWIEKGFELTDNLLKWCKQNKIYLILDLHAAPGAQGNDVPISDKDITKPSLWQSEANQKKTIALWRKLAERYKNEEWIGGYDLINETNYGFTNPADKNGCAEKENVPLKKLHVEITNAIRAIDKNHIIFVEGNCWGNNYDGMFPLWDNNLVVSFHKYWNYNDQGSIQKFLDIREKQNVPIWLGESGENSNDWFTQAIALMEKNKIGWAWWPMKKLGGNNPVQIKKPEGYDNIISYWKGEAQKPSADDAWKTFQQLAFNANIDNNILRKDVVDAMFRQVKDSAVLPFRSNSIADNSIVYAVDYDLGRNNKAYADADAATYHVSTGKNTPWNKGHQYRNDGVDIEVCNDSITNGYSVGWTEDGEWLQYTLENKLNKPVDVYVRYASSASSALQLIVNDKSLEAVTLAPTGDNKKWSVAKLAQTQFNKGKNIIRLRTVKGGANINYLQFTERK